MQFQQAPSRALAEEEERIDMLVRRLMFTGLMLCISVASGAWVTTLLGA